MISLEPLFHFLEQLDFFRVACWVWKACDGAAVIEFPVFKAARKFRELIMGNHPAVGANFFYFKLFHISFPLQPAAALSLLWKSKISGFIFIAVRFRVKSSRFELLWLLKMLFFRSFFPLSAPIFCAEPRHKRISTAHERSELAKQYRTTFRYYCWFVTKLS